MSSPSEKWKKEFNSDRRIKTFDETIDLFALRRDERLKVLQTLLPEVTNEDDDSDDEEEEEDMLERNHITKIIQVIAHGSGCICVILIIAPIPPHQCIKGLMVSNR